MGRRCRVVIRQPDRPPADSQFTDNAVVGYLRPESWSRPRPRSTPQRLRRWEPVMRPDNSFCNHARLLSRIRSQSFVAAVGTENARAWLPLAVDSATYTGSGVGASATRCAPGSSRLPRRVRDPGPDGGGGGTDPAPALRGLRPGSGSHPARRRRDRQRHRAAW